MSDTPTLSPDTTTSVSTSRQPWAEAAARKVVVAEVTPAEVAPAEVAPAEVAPAEVAPAEEAPATTLTATTLQREIAPAKTTSVEIVAPQAPQTEVAEATTSRSEATQVEATQLEATQVETTPETATRNVIETAPQVVTPTVTETPSRVENAMPAQHSRAVEEAPAQASSTRLPVAAPPTFPKRASTLEEMKRDEQVAGLVMKARLELRRGQKDQARNDIAQALSLNSTDIGALELMGDVFVEEGEHEKAILVFKKGLAHHPQHAAFEEKMAIAQLDIEEMKIAEVMRQMAVKGEVPDEMADIKPGRAATLSLLIPGGGQFYLEQNERGAMYLGAAVLTLCGWALPLKSAMSGAGEAVRSTGNIMSAWSNAIASMSGGTRALFWLSMTLYSALYLLSAWDAVTHIARMKEERKRALGL